MGYLDLANRESSRGGGTRSALAPRGTHTPLGTLPEHAQRATSPGAWPPPPAAHSTPAPTGSPAVLGHLCPSGRLKRLEGRRCRGEDVPLPAVMAPRGNGPGHPSI